MYSMFFSCKREKSVKLKLLVSDLTNWIFNWLLFSNIFYENELFRYPIIISISNK